MKCLTLFSVCFSCFAAFAQEKITIVESRKDVPLQAVVGLDANPQLFVGQNYLLSIGVSSEHDVKIDFTNLKAELMEVSKRSTGGLMYTVTPLDTGTCWVSVGVITETSRHGLLSSRFQAIPYPVPPVFLSETCTGEVLSTLPDDAKLTCKYPRGSGVYDNYTIDSWTARLGEQTFNGKGNTVSRELIEAVNKHSAEQILRITANLSENKTGHVRSEAVFIVQ